MEPPAPGGVHTWIHVKRSLHHFPHLNTCTCPILCKVKSPGLNPPLTMDSFPLPIPSSRSYDQGFINVLEITHPELFSLPVYIHDGPHAPRSQPMSMKHPVFEEGLDFCTRGHSVQTSPGRPKAILAKPRADVPSPKKSPSGMCSNTTTFAVLAASPLSCFVRCAWQVHGWCMKIQANGENLIGPGTTDADLRVQGNIAILFSFFFSR